MSDTRYARRMEYLVAMYIAGSLMGEIEDRFFSNWNALRKFPEKISDNRLIQMAYIMLHGGDIYNPELRKFIRDYAVSEGELGQRKDGYR